MGVNFVLAFVLIINSFINAYDYVILDDSDLWDTDEQNVISEPHDIISSLCENYDITLNNERIECANIQLTPKLELEQNRHVIQKRDAPDPELEGSGNDELVDKAALPDTALNNETSAQQENEAVLPIPKSSSETEVKEKDNNENPPVQISNFAEANLPVEVPDTPKSNETEPSQPIADSKNEQSVGVTTDAPVQTTPVPKQENVPPKISNFAPANLPVQGSETPSNETELPKPVDNEKSIDSTTVAPVQPTHVPVPLGDKTEESEKSEPKATNETASQTEKSDDAKEEHVLPPLVHDIDADKKKAPENAEAPKQPDVPEKEGGASSDGGKLDAGKEESVKVLPSDLAEVDSVNKKESESVNDQQSGSAVLLKSPTSDGKSIVEGSEGEETLKGMQENAKIINEVSEQPTTGESATKVSRAGKDTTILVVLFVVVLAIGGAAFAHNYIKKRKRNASANSELVNGIRRSLQNLSSNTGKNTDVEQGTELKPLMKDGSPTKEYTDAKKEVA